MRMPVVNIREMRMTVLHCLMLVLMAVGLIAIPRKVMAMLVVLIVAVLVRMQHSGVCMPMQMVLGQVQPDSGCHKHRRQPEHRAGGLA